MSRKRRFGLSNDSDREAWTRARLAELPRGYHILDIGAGELRFKPACAHLRYVSQDFGQYDGEGDGLGLQTGTFDQSGTDILCDLTEIPAPDGSFDAILCTEVLEHVPDPLAALREMARLLRSGGRLILTMPFVSFTHFSPHHYHTGFSRYWYEYWLPRHGFKILRLEPAGDDGYFDFVAQEFVRLPSMWARYSRRAPPLTRVVGLLLRLLRIPLRAVLYLLHRWSRTSVDFSTHRWCCLAERV